MQSRCRCPKGSKAHLLIQTLNRPFPLTVKDPRIHQHSAQDGGQSLCSNEEVAQKNEDKILFYTKVILTK